MIMFYDLLVHDDTYNTDTYDTRRQRLCSPVHWIPGRAAIGSRKNIDLSSRHAPEQTSRGHYLEALYSDGKVYEWG
jgi:hypothetical protein